MEEKKENTRKAENHLKEEKKVTLTEAEYLKLKEEAQKGQENWDKLVRLQAEFENTRKRLDKEKQEYLKFAIEAVVLELLNIMDDLERTIELAQAKHEDLPAFLKGVEMILAHLYEMLKEHGVRPMEAKGKPFDPNFHEALMQEHDAAVPEHTVTEELQKGYLLNGRVIRTAKVKVAVAKPDATAKIKETGTDK